MTDKFFSPALSSVNRWLSNLQKHKHIPLVLSVWASVETGRPCKIGRPAVRHLKMVYFKQKQKQNHNLTTGRRLYTTINIAKYILYSISHP